MAGQHYCLRWNNYQSNMTSVFHHLLRTEAFVDVTLACNTDSIKAHKVVLSACSSYFQKILLDNPSQHPTIIMPYDICFNDLKFIIEFVYRGEIDVSQSELQSLLKTADQLKIKGLCEVPEGCDSSDMPGAEVTPLDPPLSPSPPPQQTSLARVCKIRKLTFQTKKKIGLESRKRFYRETLQQYKKNLNQAHDTHMLDEDHEELVDSHEECEDNILQSQQTMHQTHQRVQQNQTLHQAQQIVEQHTVHQEHSMMQTQHLARQPQHQHLQAHDIQDHSDQHDEDSTQEQEMYEAVVTTIDDCELDEMTSVDALNNCITVATSTDDDDHDHLKSGGVVILDNRGHHLTHADAIMMTSPPPIMATHSHSQQVMLDSSGLNVHTDVESLTADVATQDDSPDPTLLSSPSQEMTVMTSVEGRMSLESSPGSPEDVKVKFETLRAMDSEIEIDDQDNSHLTQDNCTDESTEHTMHTMMITPELLGLIPSSSASTPQQTETITSVKREVTVNKTWSQEDMDAALDALRTHSMSLTKASITYGIPSTTLWQRAHRLGIDTPKKDGPAKSWTEDVLNVALEALRNGSISANKASKAYGIPSSTLYKIARREGIRLTPPFNAVPTTWSSEDLERALEAIRSGQTTVQRAAADYGIPSGTLYGRCKREGIELSRSNPTPWSEDAMTEALDAVKLGQMSINQAAIHYNLPYSSLYGRFKRVKYEADHPTIETEEIPLTTTTTTLGPGHQIMLVQYQQPTMYQHTPS